MVRRTLELVVLMVSPFVGTILLLSPLTVFDHSEDFHPIVNSAMAWLPGLCVVGCGLWWYRKAWQSDARTGPRWITFCLLMGGHLVWWVGALAFFYYAALAAMAPVPHAHGDVIEVVEFGIPCLLVSTLCAWAADRRLVASARFRGLPWGGLVVVFALLVAQPQIRRALARYDRSVALATISRGGSSEHFRVVSFDARKSDVVPYLRQLAQQENTAPDAISALAEYDLPAGWPIVREIAQDRRLPAHTRALAVEAVQNFRHTAEDFAALDRDPSAKAKDEEWISSLLHDDEAEVRKQAFWLTQWEVLSHPGRVSKQLVDRLHVASQDAEPSIQTMATLLLAKLGDASSYAIVLGWLRSDAASVSLCGFVLEEYFAFPLDDTRYEELLGAIADNAKCADKAEEALFRKSVRERHRGASAGH
jgi:hypothetical protein